MTLRIQRSAKEDVVTFTLSGRIKAEEIAELQRLFEIERQGHCIVLDLKEVKLVDQDAVRFLAGCEANGTQLVNCPAYVREWIAREGP
jgi:anti-anti-sigma regulatory factor